MRVTWYGNDETKRRENQGSAMSLAASICKSHISHRMKDQNDKNREEKEEGKAIGKKTKKKAR